MAVTVIQGSRATAASYGVNADKRVEEIKDEIFLLEPSAAPLVLLTNKARREEVQNPEFKWLEQESIPFTDRVNNGSGHTAGDLTIDVDNGAYFQPNMTVLVQRTGEVMFVSSVSSNELTVTRSWGGTAAAALLDNDQLTILGSTALEGTTSETAWGSKSVTKNNYTEIVRDPFQVTRTVMVSDLYGGADLDVMAKVRGIEHAQAIELKILFGEKNEDTSGNTPRRSTGGVEELISSYSDDYGGAFSLEELNSSAENMFRYGSNTKMLFAGKSAISSISTAAAGLLELVPADKTFGIAINRLLTPHGVFNVVKHDLFEGDTHAKMGLVVDIDNLGYAFLRDSDTKLRMNIQANDSDTRKDEYLTEMGLFRAHERTHGKISNMA
jgi:hypothetical protein